LQTLYTELLLLFEGKVRLNSILQYDANLRFFYTIAIILHNLPKYKLFVPNTWRLWWASVFL